MYTVVVTLQFARPSANHFSHRRSSLYCYISSFFVFCVSVKVKLPVSL